MSFGNFTVSNSVLIFASVVGLLIVISAAAYFYIKREYVKYCDRMNLRESIQERIDTLRSFQEYFRRTYDSNEDHTVYENIKTKTDFLMKLISKRSDEDKMRLYNRLFDMMYETGVRLKQDYDNVSYIISPLNSLRDELITYHMNFIRDHIDEKDMEGL